MVWFTGLSGAGKSTLSAAIAASLRLQRVPTEVLDTDEVRTKISNDLGFSRSDRIAHQRCLAPLAERPSRNSVRALVAASSPHRETRAWCRAIIAAPFVEVYVRASLETCAAGNVKGLYKRRFAGEIPNFTGISDVYEAPTESEVLIDSENQSIAEGVAAGLQALEFRGVISKKQYQSTP